jgi:PQQ-like domain
MVLSAFASAMLVSTPFAFQGTNPSEAPPRTVDHVWSGSASLGQCWFCPASSPHHANHAWRGPRSGGARRLEGGLKDSAQRQESPAFKTSKTEAADRIVALDPRWTVSFETAPAATAGFDQEHAYVPLKGGELVAIDLNRGEVTWRVELATTFTPATGDGLVFAVSDRLISALDQRTGRTLWRTPLEGAVVAPLYWDTGWLIASIDGGELVALRAEDGQILWRQPLGSPLAATPSPSGDRLYIALKDGRLGALHLDTGAPAWMHSLNEEVTGILALDDQLVVGTRNNKLHAGC